MLNKRRRISAFMMFDLKSQLRPAVLFAFFAPALAAGLVILSLPAGVLTGGSVKPFKIAAVCEDPVAMNFIRLANDTINVIEDIIICEMDEAFELLESDEIAGIVRLPPGIDESLQFRRQSVTQVWTNKNFQAESALIISFIESVTQSVSVVQGAIYSFDDIAAPLYDTRENFKKAEDAISRGLLYDMTVRSRYIFAQKNSYDYAAQLIFILTFMCAAAAAVYTAVHTAGQLSSGVYARIKTAGVGFFSFTSIKMFMNALTTTLTSAPILCAAYLLKLSENINAARLFACALICSAYMFAVAHTIACKTQNAKKTAAAVLTAAFFLLVLGGGAYPSYLMGVVGKIGRFSPAAYTLDMIVWSFDKSAFPRGALICLAVSLCLIPIINAGKRRT